MSASELRFRVLAASIILLGVLGAVPYAAQVQHGGPAASHVPHNMNHFKSPVTAYASAGGNQYNQNDQIVISLSRHYKNMFCFGASADYADTIVQNSTSCMITSSNGAGILFGVNSRSGYKNVFNGSVSGPVTHTDSMKIGSQSAVFVTVRCLAGNCSSDYINISLLTKRLQGSNCAASRPLQDYQSSVYSSEAVLYYCPDVPAGRYSVSYNAGNNPSAYVQVEAYAFPYAR